MNPGSDDKLWPRIRSIVVIGWIAAAIRFGLEWSEGTRTMAFGVWIVVPPVLLLVGWTRGFAQLPWKRLALGMVLIALLVWGLPNAISYSVAQFQGWQHGRFAPDRTMGLQAAALMKVLGSLAVAGLTSLTAAVALVLLGTVAFTLPGLWQRRRRRPA